MSQSLRADEVERSAQPLDAEALRNWLMPDASNADKYARGTVLVVGGSRSTPGAVLLAGVAALRMGAGRLRMATEESVAGLVGVAVPEAMVIGLPPSATGLAMSDELAKHVGDVQTVVVGPGMVGDSPPTELLNDLCDAIADDAVLVVDALALAAFRDMDTHRREAIADRTVLTPNQQETARLAGLSETDDLDETVRTAAQTTGAVVTSFGTVQAPDGRAWRTVAASKGLGTSGSGDVLAGLVAGAAARCGDALQAACWATYAHHESSRRLSADVAPAGYLASELLAHVPQSIADVERDAARRAHV